MCFGCEISTCRKTYFNKKESEKNLYSKYEKNPFGNHICNMIFEKYDREIIEDLLEKVYSSDDFEKDKEKLRYVTELCCFNNYENLLASYYNSFDYSDWFTMELIINTILSSLNLQRFHNYKWLDIIVTQYGDLHTNKLREKMNNILEVYEKITVHHNDNRIKEKFDFLKYLPIIRFLYKKNIKLKKLNEIIPDAYEIIKKQCKKERVLGFSLSNKAYLAEFINSRSSIRIYYNILNGFIIYKKCKNFELTAEMISSINSNVYHFDTINNKCQYFQIIKKTEDKIYDSADEFENKMIHHAP